MDRKGYIGGSDISAVLGVSRWKTPLQLWAEKTGKVEPADLSDNEAVQLGTELEDFVARKFERMTGMKVRRPPINHYTHPKVEWAKAQVDRLIEGTDELLEVKTCSAWKLKEWDGESIPQEYICQVFWQLLVTGKSVGWIAVLIGGQKFLYKKIDADRTFQEDMLAKAMEFWNMVQNNTPPSAVSGDDDVLLALHPKADDQIQAVQEMNDSIRLLQETKGQIKALEEQKEAIEVKLKECISDKLGIKTSEYIVKWTPTPTSRVDVDAMKSAGIYEQYLKKSESRRLTIKLNKPDGK
jgi:putative phage-type endonuclease